MAKNDIFARNSGGELVIRTVNTTGDTSPNKNDVHTRDAQGRLSIRVVGQSATGGGADAATTPFDPTGLKVLKGTNVQTALSESDSALADLQDSVSILSTSVQLANSIGADTVLMLDELKAMEIDGRPSYKLPGATVYAPNGQQGILHSVDADNQTAVIKTTVIRQSVSTDTGMRGDYCSQYAVVKAPNGKPTVGSNNTVNLPAGLVLECPGTRANPATPLITLASAQTITLESTTDCYIVYAGGEIKECNQICFMPTEPAQSSAKCGIWFDGTEWKIRTDDTGNVFRAARCHPLAKCIFTNGVLTRLSFVGWYDLD